MTARPPRVGIKDVAQAAGVSVGTVSHVLNRPERVSERRRAAVRAAIEELGYVPNHAARQLKVGSVHSELERIFRRDVERAHGLPTGARQVQGLRYRTDVEYLGGAVITELDGRLGHEGEGRFRDMDRDNHHAVHGRVTLRYGWADVTEGPCKVARQIAAVLYAHGWQGVLTPCPNCRLMHNAEDRAA